MGELYVNIAQYRNIAVTNQKEPWNPARDRKSNRHGGHTLHAPPLTFMTSLWFWHVQTLWTQLPLPPPQFSITAHDPLYEWRAVAFYLGLLDQLMELCEQFCNSGISRHEGHGIQGRLRGGKEKRTY